MDSNARLMGSHILLSEIVTVSTVLQLELAIELSLSYVLDYIPKRSTIVS